MDKNSSSNQASRNGIVSRGRLVFFEISSILACMEVANFLGTIFFHETLPRGDLVIPDPGVVISIG